MPSNVLKSGYVTYQAEEKRIIDTSQLFARKMEHISGTDGAPEDALMGEENTPELYDDMDPEQARALFGEEVESTSIFREITPEVVQVQETKQSTQSRELENLREEMISQAQAEIEQMQEKARLEIEQLKEETLQSAWAEGKKQGYDTGYREGTAAVEEERKKLELERQQLSQAYENKIEELEPVFVEQITRIYEHVFKVSLREDVEILIHLIDVALHGIESGKDFVIRTCKDDYPFVSMQKKKLISSIAGASIDVVEDITLKRGQCLIETGGGIFDCSVDLEVQELGKKLRLLSRQNEETR